MSYLLSEWIEVLRGNETNWSFFTQINGGWLEMEFKSRYGDNPTEENYWEWMWINAKTITLPTDDYLTLLDMLELGDDK